MAVNFADRLLAAIEAKRSHVVVGLDLDPAQLPAELVEKHGALSYSDSTEQDTACCREFIFDLLTALVEEAVAVKPQLAYFEALGARGYALYEEVVARARSLGYLVIADAKRGDIGSTAEAYARAHLDRVGADAMTVNPWFGTDGLEPFLARARDDGKGVFVLVKTSNPSSAEIQDQPLASGGLVYERVAELLRGWALEASGDRGYSSVGAVVGGTHPEQAAAIRSALPGIPLLIPGYGAQGATAPQLAGVFDASGTGALVNSSRAILHAYRKRGGSWAGAAREEAAEMKAELWRVAHGG